MTRIRQHTGIPNCPSCGHYGHDSGDCHGVDYGANGREPGRCLCGHQSEPVYYPPNYFWCDGCGRLSVDVCTLQVNGAKCKYYGKKIVLNTSKQ